MIGEFTEELYLYENLAKANNVEVTTEVNNLLCDIVTFKQQKEKSKEQQDLVERLKNRNEFQKYVVEQYGNFYFNFYDRLLNKIEMQYLTRFLYLCTYLDYNNRLVERKGNKNICITEKELQFILKLSTRETLNTKKALIENDLIAIENNAIVVNEKYCKKGDIIKNKKVGKVRMFDNAIKELYEMASKTEHKKLAILFQLLPHINLRWNVVCKNPTEEDPFQIIPYSMKEIMELLGQTNVTRLRKSLLSLTVGNENVVKIEITGAGESITINPKVYYKGVDIEELKLLNAMFECIKNINSV